MIFFFINPLNCFILFLWCDFAAVMSFLFLRICIVLFRADQANTRMCCPPLTLARRHFVPKQPF